jgi:hypothetical protein
MPAPTGTFQRPDLGLLFEQFDLQGDLGYVAARVAPPFSTPRQTANFSVVAVGDLLRDGDLSRAPGSGYKRYDYTFTQDSYATLEYGAEEPIDDRERQIYSYSFDVEQVAARRIAARILRNLEIKAATLLQDSSSTFSSYTTTAGTAWSDVSSSDPIEDVRTAAIAIRGACGLNPMNLCGICDWRLFEYLRDNEAIIQRLKYAGFNDPNKAKITHQMIADALGLKELIVAGGVKNTSDRGRTTSISSIWDYTKFTLAHLASSNDLREPCVARTFEWSGDNANAAGIMEEYREEQSRSQIIRCRSEFHVKAIYAASGYVLTSCA